MKKQKGIVLIFICASLLALFAMAALSLDLGYGYLSKRKLQRAADSAALYAVRDVQQSSPQTLSKAQAMFTANSIPTNSIVSVDCGIIIPTDRDDTKFLKCSSSCANNTAGISCTTDCSSCSSSSANAVRVIAQQSVPTFFSAIINVSSLTPKVTSIAMATFQNSSACVKPFGIVGQGNQSVLTGVSVGQTFQIGTTSSGNWGRLNPGGAYNGSTYPQALMTGACDSTLATNQDVQIMTGNASQTGTIFQSMKDNGLSDYMYFPVVTQFNNGNSGGGTVQVLSYLMATLVSVDIPNGNNFTATFRLDALNVTPPSGGGSGTMNRRYLKG